MSRSDKFLLVIFIGVIAVQLGTMLIALVMAVISGSAWGWLYFQTEVRNQLTLLASWLIWMLAFFGISFLTLAIHEGGHALAARLVGNWLYQCKIGPLVITRARQGFRLHLTRIDLWRGYVMAYPSYGPRLRLRMIIFWGGGPLASLLWVVVSIWPFTLLGSTAAMYSFNAAIWLTGLLVAALLVTVSTFWSALIPYASRRGNQSDGLKLLRGLRGDPKLERNLLLACVTGLLRRGVRPRAWPADLAARLQAMLQQFPADYLLLVYAYALALDQRRIEEAGALLDRFTLAVKEKPAAGAIWALEFAFFEARHRGNLTAARAWLAQESKISQAKDLMRPRAEAAIYLLEGRPAEALSSINVSLAALAQFKKTNLLEVQMEEESLQEMLAEAQARQATPLGEAETRL
jgi:hypothetical protein